MRFGLNSWLPILVIAFGSTLSARAATIDRFTITVGSDEIEWALSSPAIPVEPGITGAGFDPAVFLNNQLTTFSEVVVEADPPLGSGDLVLNFDSSGASYSYQLHSSAFYVGPVNSPTFVSGGYRLTGALFTIGAPYLGIPVSGELEIIEESSSSPVPEPSSLALLGSGLTVCLTAFRRRSFRA